MRPCRPLVLLLLAGCPEIIEGSASGGSYTSTTDPTSADPTNLTTTSTDPTSTTNPPTTTSTDPTTTTMDPTTTTEPTSTTTSVGCEGPCVPGEVPDGLSCTADCAYDFSAVPQWLCSFGECTPIGVDVGGDSCDQPDADLFCKFLTGNPDATADVFWEPVQVQNAPGFCCLSMTPELGLGPLPKYGIDDLCYMPTPMAESLPNNSVLLASDVKCIEP